MPQQNDTMGMLDLIVQPGFCVQDHQIVHVNRSAHGLLITPGTDIRELLLTGKEEFEMFRQGCLYLTLSLGGHARNASVTRMGDFCVFLLEDDGDHAELQSMALAARVLRNPLSDIMTTVHSLFPLPALQDDPEVHKKVSQINKGLFQMFRVISNMTYAGNFIAGTDCHMETLNVTALVDGVFEKCQTLMENSSISLRYTGMQEAVFSLADKDKLERAILNMLSNAIKFTPAEGVIEASLTQSGRLLRLTITDSGHGISDSILGTVFNRYQRQPMAEDPNFGLGLGMVLIRSVATLHGGTVLLDQPEGKGTRITMTIQPQKRSEPMVRSVSPLSVDYAGGWDHTLIELSDALDNTLYEIRSKD